MDLLKNLQKLTDYHKGVGEKFELACDDIEIKNIIFTGYDISYSWFTNVQFKECDFTNVDMDCLQVHSSIFENCKFENNNFVKGNANKVEFKESYFKNLRAFRSSFYKTKFKDMVVMNSSIDQCDFLSTMVNIVFEKTNLAFTNFDDSDFQSVVFKECYFEDTTFRNVKNWDEVDFENSRIKVDGEVKEISGNEIKDFLNAN